MSKVILPLRRVTLPSAQEIFPYLSQIDQNRWYTNYGPLYDQFNDKMAQHFNVNSNQVICVANATAALTLALLASNIKPSYYCVMPSFTFAATPCAALMAGLTPWFCDINKTDWVIDPDRIYSLLKQKIPVGAVIVVSPYGAPIDVASWCEFKERTGIPVIFDAAWCFDSIQASIIPAVISLHATKVFGIGEGGLVLSQETHFIKKIKQLSNFGLENDRCAYIAGNNSKLSEYAAAVGLAAYEKWPEQRRLACNLAGYYFKQLMDVDTVVVHPQLNGAWAPGTFPLYLRKLKAQMIVSQLYKSGIEARASWWGKPCHLQPAFSHFPQTQMSVTNYLNEHLINLPFSLQMQERDVNFILERLGINKDVLNECETV